MPDFQFVDANPYLGFDLLANVLCSPSDEASPFSGMYLWYKDNDTTAEREVDRYLGAGTFSFVYKLNQSRFVKIPRSPSHLRGLKLEKQTLDRLHRDSSHPCIPMSPKSELGIFGFRRECEKSEVPGLELSGLVGTAASAFKYYDNAQLKKIFDDVESALKHAHDVDIYHLDVRPSNIIVDADEASFKVQLGDWGCARSTMGQSIKGFWGCAPFAHDEIHLKDKKALWKPKVEYDFASLAFTMVALIEGLVDEVLWPDFFGNDVDEVMLTKRRRMCCTVIDKSDFDPDFKDVLKRFLPGELTLTEAQHARLQGNQADATAPEEQRQEEPTALAASSHIMEEQGRDEDTTLTTTQPEAPSRKRNIEAIKAKNRSQTEVPPEEDQSTTTAMPTEDPGAADQASSTSRQTDESGARRSKRLKRPPNFFTAGNR